MVEVVVIGSGKCRFDAGDADAIKALRVSLHLNLAAGAIKCKEYYGALAAANVALALQPGGVKPLYRKAQALLALQDYAECESALADLLKTEPNNSAARRRDRYTCDVIDHPSRDAPPSVEVQPCAASCQRPHRLLA